jgi:hypothetical protein
MASSQGASISSNSFSRWASNEKSQILICDTVVANGRFSLSKIIDKITEEPQHHFAEVLDVLDRRSVHIGTRISSRLLRYVWV